VHEQFKNRASPNDDTLIFTTLDGAQKDPPWQTGIPPSSQPDFPADFDAIRKMIHCHLPD